MWYPPLAYTKACAPTHMCIYYIYIHHTLLYIHAHANKIITMKTPKSQCTVRGSERLLTAF